MELTFEILEELNFNKKISYEKIYEVSKLDIIDKIIIKIPQMEKDLEGLRNNNKSLKKSISKH
jgi:hypothetical protein